jgi:hypothetical protein
VAEACARAGEGGGEGGRESAGKKGRRGWDRGVQGARVRSPKAVRSDRCAARGCLARAACARHRAHDGRAALVWVAVVFIRVSCRARRPSDAPRANPVAAPDSRIQCPTVTWDSEDDAQSQR